jgi:Protein of unknown function (DUF2637)
VTSDYPVMRGPRAGDPHLRLRLAALAAVIAGVILVAVAAFLLSYAGIHEIALQAGVAPGLAQLYPLMFDAMLVISGSAVLALRSAGLGTKCYVWVCLLLVIAAMAVGDALYATGVYLTSQAARAVIAVIPWVLLLMGFGVWLVMLRQWRRARAAAAASAAEASQASPPAQAAQPGRDRPAIEGPAPAARGAVTWAGGRGAAPARTGPPRTGIDALLERQVGRFPAAAEAPAAEAQTGTPGQQEQRTTAALDELRPAGDGPAGGNGHDGGHKDGAPADGSPADSAPADGSPADDGPADDGPADGKDKPAGEPATAAALPASMPNFDRLRSTPTPPQETEASTGASGE